MPLGENTPAYEYAIPIYNLGLSHTDNRYPVCERNADGFCRLYAAAVPHCKPGKNKLNLFLRSLHRLYFPSYRVQRIL